MKFGDIVYDAKDTTKGMIFAVIVGHPDWFAVSVRGGKTMFYCAAHQRMFPPGGTCPDCAKNEHG